MWNNRKNYTRDKFDRFYTKPEVVDYILNNICLKNYKLIVEPSAGNGAFSKKIDNCLAFDIEPAGENIIKQDFLQYKYNGNIERSKILCIGNPPYGVKSSLAIKFMKQCSQFADTIAFVLPLSFRKASTQNRVPKTYHLQQELRLSKNSFIYKGKPYHVPSVFQLWKNLYKNRDPIQKTKPIGFEYTKKEHADFSVRRIGGLAGKGYLDLDKSIQSHYFIKAIGINVEKVVEQLNNYNWEHENTVGPKSISQPELNEVLNPIIEEYDERKNQRAK